MLGEDEKACLGSTHQTGSGIAWPGHERSASAQLQLQMRTYLALSFYGLFKRAPLETHAGDG
jgi:hypothetical protein